MQVIFPLPSPHQKPNPIACPRYWINDAMDGRSISLPHIRHSHPTTTISTTKYHYHHYHHHHRHYRHLTVFASQGGLDSICLGWPTFIPPPCADGHGDSPRGWLFLFFFSPCVPSPQSTRRQARLPHVLALTICGGPYTRAIRGRRYIIRIVTSGLSQYRTPLPLPLPPPRPPSLTASSCATRSLCSST